MVLGMFGAVMVVVVSAVAMAALKDFRLTQPGAVKTLAAARVSLKDQAIGVWENEGGASRADGILTVSRVHWTLRFKVLTSIAIVLALLFVTRLY
jgi:hypothetical protein